jgi:hypothetical protein
MMRNEIVEKLKETQVLFESAKSSLAHIEETKRSKQQMLSNTISIQVDDYRIQLAHQALANEPLTVEMESVGSPLDSVSIKMAIEGLEKLASNHRLQMESRRDEHRRLVHDLFKLDQDVLVQKMEAAREAYLSSMAELIQIGGELQTNSYRVDVELEMSSLQGCEIPEISSKRYSSHLGSAYKSLVTRHRLYDLIRPHLGRLGQKYLENLSVDGIQLKLKG